MIRLGVSIVETSTINLVMIGGARLVMARVFFAECVVRGRKIFMYGLSMFEFIFSR